MVSDQIINYGLSDPFRAFRRDRLVIIARSHRRDRLVIIVRSHRRDRLVIIVRSHLVLQSLLYEKDLWQPLSMIQSYV